MEIKCLVCSVLISLIIAFTSQAQPDLVVTNVSAPSIGHLNQIIDVTIKTKNQGNSKTLGGFKVEIRLSTDKIISDSDKLLLEYMETAILGPEGGAVSVTKSITIPQNTPIGDYYVGVIVDTKNWIAESNDNNNTGYDPDPISIKPQPAQQQQPQQPVQPPQQPVQQPQPPVQPQPQQPQPAQIQQLSNGQSVNGNAAKDEARYYAIEVPSDATELVVKTAGTGDVDIYLKKGSKPTKSSWDVFLDQGSSNETITVNNSTNTKISAGTWYIMIYGYDGGAYTLTATYSTPPETQPPVPPPQPQEPAQPQPQPQQPLPIQQLTNGQSVSGNVVGDQQKKYSIWVPANATKLVIKITGSGDADLYVKKGSVPTLDNWDFRPYEDGSNETVTTTTSLEGTWYIMINGYADANSSYTLTATYEGQPPVEIGPIVIVSSSLQIDDDNTGDSKGNGNGKPEGGEKIELSLKLKNQGNGIANNVSAKLSTSDNAITLLNSQASFVSIQAKSESEYRKFIFSIAENVTEHKVTFKVDTTAGGLSWPSTFEITIFPKPISVALPPIVKVDKPVIVSEAAVNGSGLLYFRLRWQYPKIHLPIENVYEVVYDTLELKLKTTNNTYISLVVPIVVKEDIWSKLDKVSVNVAIFGITTIVDVATTGGTIPWSSFLVAVVEPFLKDTFKPKEMRLDRFELKIKKKADVNVGEIEGRGQEYIVQLSSDPGQKNWPISITGKLKYRIQAKPVNLTIDPRILGDHEENFDDIIKLEDMLVPLAPFINENLLLKDLAAIKSILYESKPRKNQLLQNYPNPFNPETWIPFQLAESAKVTLTIYDVRGRRIRLVDFGYMPPGYYTTRGRAAYWDGKNDYGERVSSGIYFYHIQAGEYTATRKMLLLK